jgi:hypothetical protein
VSITSSMTRKSFKKVEGIARTNDPKLLLSISMHATVSYM